MRKTCWEEILNQEKTLESEKTLEREKTLEKEKILEKERIWKGNLSMALGFKLAVVGDIVMKMALTRAMR